LHKTVSSYIPFSVCNQHLNSLNNLLSIAIVNPFYSLRNHLILGLIVNPIIITPRLSNSHSRYFIIPG